MGKRIETDVPGLRVEREVGGYGWQVLHEPSGQRVQKGFKTGKDAMQFCNDVEHLAPWPKSAKEVCNVKGLRVACNAAGIAIKGKP